MTAADFRARQRIEANDTGTPIYVDSYYDGWRDDALAAISRAAPLTKSATLAVVDGTLTYNVPSDYITITSDALDVDGYPLYRITTNTGSILVSGDNYGPTGAFQTGFSVTRAHFGVRGRSIVLASDPDYTGNWTLTYGGTWVITELPADWIEMALDYATARFYDRRGTDASASFSFSVASTSVNRDGQAGRWAQLHEARAQRFETALATVADRLSRYGTFDVERG